MIVAKGTIPKNSFLIQDHSLSSAAVDFRSEVHNSLQVFFDLLSFALAFALPLPLQLSLPFPLYAALYFAQRSLTSHLYFALHFAKKH